MKSIGIILLAFSLTRAAVSLVNLLWKHITDNILNKYSRQYQTQHDSVSPELHFISRRDDYTSNDPRLNNDKSPFSWSILIPARNEEINISLILEDIAGMRYQPQDIIIYDDNSTDKTSAIAHSFIHRLPQLRIMSGNKEPADGWLGKTHACHSMGIEAKGEYLLFIDADVRLTGEIEPTYITYAHNRGLSLLSLFPFQKTETKEERDTVPVMNWILLSLLPLPLIRYSSFRSLAAANGQFMLFHREQYRLTLPHSRFRKSHAEDIEISRYFKKEKLRTETLCADKTVGCRMYHSAEEAVEGFSKNVLHFFGNSATAAILFWTTTTLSPFYILIVNGFTLFVIYMVTTITIKISTSIVSGKSWHSTIPNSLQLQKNFGIMIARAIRNRKNRKLIWKGRNIY